MTHVNRYSTKAETTFVTWNASTTLSSERYARRTASGISGRVWVGTLPSASRPLTMAAYADPSHPSPSLTVTRPDVASTAPNKARPKSEISRLTLRVDAPAHA